MSQRKSRVAATRGKEANLLAAAKRQPTRARPTSAAVSTGERNATAYAAWIFPLLLIGIGLATYFNSFEGAFLLDDRIRIVNNQQIRQFWPHLAAFIRGVRPILQVSVALNYAVGGLDPWGYHAFNLITHLVAGLLLFGIVRRMLESESLRARYGAASRWLALAVAAIWLAHPLQTESVTYIIQRAESLMGLFFLLTLYCGVRACGSPHPRRWGIAAVVACALGMGTKEVMVTAPILMLLYDRMFIASSFRDAIRRRWGLYAGLTATWLVLGLAMVVNPPDEPMFIVSGLNPWSYAATQFEVIVHYLRLAIWPAPLVFDCAWPIAEPGSSVMPSAVIVLALGAATILALLKRAWVGFWGAWFFLILAPTSSIMPIADVAFEHRMYLSLAAVVVVAVVGAHDALGLLARRIGAPRAPKDGSETVCWLLPSWHWAPQPSAATATTAASL
jgi:protein O-mannosyl-transferase